MNLSIVGTNSWQSVKQDWETSQKAYKNPPLGKKNRRGANYIKKKDHKILLRGKKSTPKKSKMYQSKDGIRTKYSLTRA